MKPFYFKSIAELCFQLTVTLLLIAHTQRRTRRSERSPSASQSPKSGGTASHSSAPSPLCSDSLSMSQL
jgi:hypothetical protein